VPNPRKLAQQALPAVREPQEAIEAHSFGFVDLT